ncbi:MAG TPA: hypothetical protein PJ988_15310, partial [Anaerolinea sp.]|nr:hypothetical protein [Anaerolinea sp.]
MNDPIRILLLGHPAAYLDGQPIDIPRREVRGLLYYLACQRGPVSRSRLIQLLWAEMLEEDARKRLRETLARLRKTLPEQVRLVSQDDQLMLDPAGFYSDVLDFMTIADQVARPLAQMPGTAPLPEPLYLSMARGVNLWRSAGFLQEARLPDALGWDAWQREMENQLLLVERQRMLERLADHDMVTGNLTSAAGWLEKALEVDPLNDGLHQRMANLYERSGKYSEGLA